MKKSGKLYRVFLIGLGLFLLASVCIGAAPIRDDSGRKSLPDLTEQTPPAVEPSEAEPSADAPETERELPDFAESRPQIVNREELTMAVSKGEVELDFRKSYLASEAQLYTALYEGLFSYHPFTMEPVPAAASAWTVSEDKKEWTFTIRENARYWNGDPVRAEDFRAAWLSLLDPEKQSPYSSLFDIIEGALDYRLGNNTDPDKVGIHAPELRKLVVRLNNPASFFPSMLCHHSFSPIHPSMLKIDDWSRGVPISNGPFYMVEQTDDIIVLTRNELYWDVARTALRKISLKFVEDGDEATALWNSGEVRWIAGEFNPETLTDRSGIVVTPMFATHYYYIRSTAKPWTDYRVRQALSKALPWAQIRLGHSLPAKTLIYPIQGYPEVEGLDTTDIDEAKRLLSEAGYPDGMGLPELVIRLTPSPEAARIGGLMATTWKEELGVQVKVEVIPYRQYFTALKQNDYQVAFSTWIGDFPDPYTFLQMWRRDSNLNDARYNDADYEELMDRSMTEEGKTRMETLAAAEKLLLDRGAVLPISYSPAVNIVDTDELEGWFPNALDIHPFKYFSFKAFRPLPGVVLLTK
ncbi:peptide ABC transporter substrate-binding protein [Treponema primitia]|uniref:peptide ABC transporter substrate-binding protein n=1 Tax=Treponema primitia TaxID=88058 RepID=UPI000255563C|nr:peptide ABC transporter substrate-binding protein [Treponema primitia]